MDIGRILPGIAILSGQVAPHEDHDKDDKGFPKIPILQGFF